MPISVNQIRAAAEGQPEPVLPVALVANVQAIAREMARPAVEVLRARLEWQERTLAETLPTDEGENL